MDEIDRKILRLLKLNGRRPNAEIAQEVGLSASACFRRIKMMEQHGVIRGYTVIVATSDESDRRVNFLIQVTLDRQTEDYLARFERAVREIPEVLECFLMTGDADYWLRLQTEDASAYEDLHVVLSRLPGVARINSSFALRDAMRPRPPRR